MRLANERNPLRPVIQMLMDDDQLTAAELRELLIRHIKSGPFDSRNAPVSEALVRAWIAAYRRDRGRPPDLIYGIPAYELLKQYFVAAFNTCDRAATYADDMWVWPVSLPNPTRTDIEYPRELLVTLGQVIGSRVGHAVEKDQPVLQLPKN